MLFIILEDLYSMDFIYISEEGYDGYVPDFTIPGQDCDHVKASRDKKYTSSIAASSIAAGATGAAMASSAAGLSGFAGTMALGTLSAFTPISLLVGASFAIPALYKLIVSDEGSEHVPESSMNELRDFITKHSMTKHDALRKGYKFPPGHPQVGETYKLHPLASYKHASKEKLYIPEYVFDDVLFEERESELLTLLVNLGATDIQISKYTESLFNKEGAGSLGGGVDSVVDGSVEINTSLSRENSEKNVRNFSLQGKPWQYGDKIDRTGYAWLNFEPSWNALITAREIGGCTGATLEIKEASKYASNKEASIQLKAKIYTANGTLKFMEKDLEETSYLVKVSFSEAKTT
ncbi:hypothetical protein FXE82_14735 [Vibrio cholerae]|uniref:hypothetical protein n=1 Tax=Vibrio cholerae TaxID=666 RepID=UPI0010FDED43|nr:hypothetical protein [Vibrio cholerae]EKF9792723.1 hypothetical protein [Vibrio cholerae]ELJ8549595.1 hypothetical protein [Vibrio cholerae]ELY5189458.1 hypothetical protein [Vibrio cholerae]ELY5289402.1 hypothetical protein [Vibrio cholerae]NOE61253.1 hypothetical protein [Vibrio cholerae]